MWYFVVYFFRLPPPTNMTNQERNKLIYQQHQKGHSQTLIGQFYGLSQSAVSLIIIEQRSGKAADKEDNRGAESKLSDKDLERLKKLLEEGASQEGFSGWNKWTVQSLIKKEFGVDYHQNYISRLLKRIGYSSQLPVLRDYRQDAAKVKTFKEEKVAELKKK